MAVFTYRMPAGIPGAIMRAQEATVDAAVIDTTNPPTAYGVPVVIDATSKNMRKVIAGDTASSVFGVYVRPFPTANGSTADGLGTSTPPTTGIGNVLKRGYINAMLNYGTAAKGGAVYVRTVTGAASIIGGFEAASDSTNSFVLPGAYFNGTADSSGNVEIAFNL